MTGWRTFSKQQRSQIDDRLSCLVPWLTSWDQTTRAGSDRQAYYTGAYYTVWYGIIPSGSHNPSYNWYYFYLICQIDLYTLYLQRLHDLCLWAAPRKAECPAEMPIFGLPMANFKQEKNYVPVLKLLLPKFLSRNGLPEAVWRFKECIGLLSV